MEHKGRILSGMRPTGRLHIGNYLGALKNWVDLQDSYECVYCAVDVHALTTITSPEDTKEIRPNIQEMVMDWLAAGLDPERSIVFVQSHVPEVMTLPYPLEHDHSPRLAHAGAHLQREGAPDERDRGERQLRTGRLPGAPDCGHHPVQGRRGTRRRGPTPPTWSCPGRSCAGSTTCSATLFPSLRRS